MTVTEDPEPISQPLLSLSDVVAGYGAGDVLKGVSLKVWESQGNLPNRPQWGREIHCA
jgi:hypothetical protein